MKFSNPPYLSDIKDQSAVYDWDENQHSTLPSDVFKKLSDTNLFYINEINEDISRILNLYFDCILVTISPTWLAPVLNNFEGAIIYRVYGQTFRLSDELTRLGVDQIIKDKSDFYFLPHAEESVMKEDQWLTKNKRVTPYCILDDVFAHHDSWVGLDDSCGDIVLSCPNISNPFYMEHYNFLKKNFHEPYFKIYGVQLEYINDPSVVGTIKRYQLIDRFRHSLCYLYTYSDSRVCYLPPIEAMVIGLPVIFPEGSLLDFYFKGIDTPGRYSNLQQCKNIIERLRGGDDALANHIIQYQDRVIERYKPSSVWPLFDRTIVEIMELK